MCIRDRLTEVGWGAGDYAAVARKDPALRVSVSLTCSSGGVARMVARIRANGGTLTYAREWWH
eukprot:242673-Rhodomonas_salina.5